MSDLHPSTRQATIRLLELVDAGVMDPKTAMEACLSYMSEADVADMCRLNDFFYDPDETDEEDEDADD